MSTNWLVMEEGNKYIEEFDWSIVIIKIILNSVGKLSRKIIMMYLHKYFQENSTNRKKTRGVHFTLWKTRSWTHPLGHHATHTHM